jgi:DNA helicase IV
MGGLSQSAISTLPTMTSSTGKVTVADKSPNQHNIKKVGKSLKEKRNEKHIKKESKKGILGA